MSQIRNKRKEDRDKIDNLWRKTILWFVLLLIPFVMKIGLFTGPGDLLEGSSISPDPYKQSEIMNNRL